MGAKEDGGCCNQLPYSGIPYVQEKGQLIF